MATARALAVSSKRSGVATITGHGHGNNTPLTAADHLHAGNLYNNSLTQPWNTPQYTPPSSSPGQARQNHSTVTVHPPSPGRTPPTVRPIMKTGKPDKTTLGYNPYTGVTSTNGILPYNHPLNLGLPAPAYHDSRRSIDSGYSDGGYRDAYPYQPSQAQFQQQQYPNGNSMGLGNMPPQTQNGYYGGVNGNGPMGYPPQMQQIGRNLGMSGAGVGPGPYGGMNPNMIPGQGQGQSPASARKNKKGGSDSSSWWFLCF